MAARTSLVTRKGQITIPIEMRRELGIREGDRVEFVRQEDGIRVVPVVAEDDRLAALDRFIDSLPEESVVRRTAGIARKYRSAMPAMTPAERAAAEELGVDLGWTERERRYLAQRDRDGRS